MKVINAEDIYKKLANRTVRVVYVDVEKYIMWGLYDIESKETYILGEKKV